MIATWITRQLVLDGAVSGLTIGLVAIGLVLVFRSSRIINFAVGNMGAIGAALLALMVINFSFPFWVALVLALLLGTLFGTIVEFVVIRRLFNAARVTVLVATIGVAQLSRAIIEALPDVEGASGARYPQVLGSEWTIAGTRVTGAQLSIVIAVPCIALALTWFLNRTTIGKAVTASADNPRLSRTVGINPKLVSTLVWTVAGLLSTVSMVLISAQAGTVGNITNLGPNTMIRALAAVVIAGMVSFRGALLAGLAIGIGEALLRFNFLEQTGLTDFVLLVAVLVAVWLRARSDLADDVPLRNPLTPIPEHVKVFWWVRHMNSLALGGLLVVAVMLPIVVTTPSRQLLYGTILAFAICALSLVVLTGWAGQLSLGQMAFAGLGALIAAALARGPLPFAAAIVAAALVTALIAAVVGASALRVDGLLLAISTFALAIAAAQYMYRREWLTGGNTSSVPFPRGALFGLDLSSQRVYYYVLLAVLVIVMAMLARLRATGVGRSTIALRDNQRSAAAYTVAPFRARVRTFALAGGIAGLGGALLAGSVQSVPITERFFQVENSLTLVAMAVIGGMGSLVGPVLGSLWIVGLPAFFPDNELVPLFASSIGLLVLLLYMPGGFVQVVHAARDVVVRRAEARLRDHPPVAAGSPVESSATDRGPVSHDRSGPRVGHEGPDLAATDVTVRFGGITAVDRVSITVAPGEIVGLIGTNGAGKSTLLNAIGGYVDAAGRIELLGEDVSNRPAAFRAGRGLGRTFQAAQLFGELTVRETLLVALEARRRSTFTSTALMLPHAARAERAKRAEASALIDLVGLGRYADVRVDQLSTGTRRIVELAGLLALDAKVLCLDEPTAGVAQRETEALGPLLQAVRAELDASMVVIEHDMVFITELCDRLYCMEAGTVIATGDPDTVRSDPAVIASYLGTDDRAIARSGAVPPLPSVTDPVRS